MQPQNQGNFPPKRNNQSNNPNNGFNQPVDQQHYQNNLQSDPNYPYQQPYSNPNTYPPDPSKFNQSNQDFNQNQYFDTGFQTQAEINPNQTPKKPNSIKKITDFLVKKWWLVLIIVVILSVAVVAAFIFLNQPQEEAQPVVFNQVKANITAPNNLPQGTPGEWEIEVVNNESVPISNIIIRLDFDTDFEFLREISPTPDTPEGDQFSIARLDEAGGRSSSAKIRFEGIVIGKPDIETLMSGTVEYQAILGPGNLSSVQTFQIPTSLTKIQSPEVDLTLTPTNETVQNNGEAEFTVLIENRTDQEIRDIRLRLEYPAGENAFTLTSSEFTTSNTTAPKTTPDQGDNVWNIARLAGGSENTLRFRGRVIGAREARLTFGAVIEIQTEDNDFRTIREQFKDIQILAQPIILETKIQGKDNNPIIVPGETLTFEVNYNNGSQITLDNVEITSFIDDPANILDLTTLRFGSGERGDIVGDRITWQGTRIPQLASLRPNQEGTLTYQVEVKQLDTLLNNNLDQTQYTLRPGVTARAQNLEDITFSGNLYKSKGALEFFQDEPVFKETNASNNKSVYTFTWRLRTWQNEVTNVSVRTISPLPSGSWLNQVEPANQASSITYNQANGEIIWNVGRVEAYAGRGTPEVIISFDIEIDEQNSNDRVVYRAPTIEGIDVFTGEKFESEGEEQEVR